MCPQLHLVPDKITPLRLQEYGVGIFEIISTKSALKKAIKKNYLKINGKPASTAMWIKGGEKIELDFPEEVRGNVALDLPLKVLWEDDHLAVIRKPAGLPVSGNKLRTVANALSQNLKPSPFSDATRLQPVHRLDYATSRLLLVGKTGSSIRRLNRPFEERKISKTYLAICIGKMKESGTIIKEVDGKPAQSDHKVLESTESARFGVLNLAELKPETGRRHQLRKHMAGLGNPILGDKLYNIEGMVLKGKGLYLHAVKLEFVHPFTAEKIQIVDELPEKFRRIFDQQKEK